MLRARMYGVPLAVRAETFAAFASVIESDPSLLSVEALSAAVPRTGTQIGRSPGSRNLDAIVSIHGPLVNRPTAFDDLCGITSYQRIRSEIEAALDDPAIDRIVLDIDSPGGEVAGVSDLATFIREARAQKPIIAIVNESAFSAAYWIASQATRIVAPELGAVGSIGVILRHVEFSGANAKAGIGVTYITAGKRKADANPDEPLSDSARSDLQAMVDAVYDVFVRDVAAGRGISEDAVHATEAGVFMAADALRLGLIDRVAPIAEAFDDDEEEPVDDELPPSEEPVDDGEIDPDQQDEEDEVTRAEHEAAIAQAVAQARADERELVTAELRSQARTMVGIANDIGVESSVAVELFADGVSVDAARKIIFDRKASSQVDITNYAPDTNPSASAADAMWMRAAERVAQRRQRRAGGQQ